MATSKLKIFNWKYRGEIHSLLHKLYCKEKIGRPDVFSDDCIVVEYEDRDQEDLIVSTVREAFGSLPRIVHPDGFDL